jgi:hypothetical protein
MTKGPRREKTLVVGYQLAPGVRLGFGRVFALLNPLADGHRQMRADFFVQLLVASLHPAKPREDFHDLTSGHKKRVAAIRTSPCAIFNRQSSIENRQSLVPQRHHRIYFRRTPRGNGAGKQCHRDQDQGHSDKRQRVRGLHPVKQARH